MRLLPMKQRTLPVMKMRCHACSSLFDVYEGDNDLIGTGLCPECYVEKMIQLKQGRLARWFWWSVAATGGLLIAIWRLT